MLKFRYNIARGDVDELFEFLYTVNIKQLRGITEPFKIVSNNASNIEVEVY